MFEQTLAIEAIARPLIEQCRRDIAAAAAHVEAARAMLAGSRWLIARWDERRRADAITGGIHLPVYDEKRASGFIEVEEIVRPRVKKRRRRGSILKGNRHPEAPEHSEGLEG